MCWQAWKVLRLLWMDDVHPEDSSFLLQEEAEDGL
jgi:hypothetical protein